MHLMTLPPYDLADVNALSVARAEHERAGKKLARAELRAAAVILRKLWGTVAVRLIVEKRTNDQDETEIDALALFHERGHLMWFNWQEGVEHPGNEAISDDRGYPRTDMDDETLATIEKHLEAAYDAMGGCGGGALDPVMNKHLGPADANLLELNIDVALMTDDSPQRRMAAVMKAVEACGEFAARHFGDRDDVITDAALWSMARGADPAMFPGDLNDRRDAYDTPDEGAVDDDWIEQLRAAYNRGRKRGQAAA